MIAIQFFLSMIATMSFAVIFSAPKKEWLFCGLSGAIGWIVYYVLFHNDVNMVVSTMIATFALTIFSRTFAVVRKHPATVYLLSGIFPLVPGAGIYYTAYYLITNQSTLCYTKGMETFGIAAAIVFGIIFAFAIPQALFNKLYLKKSSTGQ